MESGASTCWGKKIFEAGKARMALLQVLPLTTTTTTQLSSSSCLFAHPVYSSSTPASCSTHRSSSKPYNPSLCLVWSTGSSCFYGQKQRRRQGLLVGRRDDFEVSILQEEEDDEEEEEEEGDDIPPSAEDLQCVEDIKRVLELLKKNRDMTFGEVKLTVVIEDPRQVERRRLLGIEDPDAPTRDDLVEALEKVNEGKVPRNRAALRMLAEEMVNWPNLEVEIEKTKPRKSLYAKTTDTGIDPKVAAKRLKMDWDAAAEIDEADSRDDSEVPAAVGYGALYLVTAFPVIIGISVVLILFYNSLQ